MVHRWQNHLESGAFALSVSSETRLGEPNVMYDFWTSPYPYWELQAEAPSLFESLKESALAIFKVYLMLVIQYLAELWLFLITSG